MANIVSDNVGLFRTLRPFLRRDLTTAHGIPNPVAGSILNWFDPAKPEYLAHVDEWQKALCRFGGVARWPFLDGDIQEDFSDYPMHFLAAVQQVAKLLYKWHGKPAKETDWEEVEDRLSHPLPMRLTDLEIAGIRRELSVLCPVDLNEAIGRFGPGATQEGFNSYEKWMRTGLCPDVPYNLYRANPSDPWAAKGLNPFRFTKMAEVPKSIKANRVVSSEPAMSMYAQLACADDLVAQLHAYYAGHVSLTDQTAHNRVMRHYGMATLDLSDASDHNSSDLVSAVLPQLWPVLAKVRSEFSQTPHGVFRLGTFAPMGSGVCFPVMTAVLIGITRYAFRSIGLNPASEKWSWYGDDGIVPLYIADYVCDLIERAGFKLNSAKSCFSGRYRESCGVEMIDYRTSPDEFLSEDCEITPCYIKDPLDQLDAAKVEQIVRRLNERAFPSTAKKIMELACPVRGIRWNRDLQRSELLVKTTSARSKLRKLDGYPGLNRWFSVGSLQAIERRNLRPSDHYGVETEVWTKPAWRYRPASNYPYLALWFATRA